MRQTLTWLVLFSIAMAFMESAVVIYLRKIYYPDGFRLPIRIIESSVSLVEILREAATLVMLVAIGILAGKTRIQRFAFFLFCFGTWDIFYYVFLKLFLNWPLTILEPDILFLIPVPWVGPVLAPVILSLIMILSAFVLIREEKKGKVLTRKQLALLVTGSVVVITSFTANFRDYLVVNAEDNPHPVSRTFPGYNWYIFSGGILLIALPLAGNSISRQSKRPPGA